VTGDGKTHNAAAHYRLVAMTSPNMHNRIQSLHRMGSTIICLVISRHILNGQKGSQLRKKKEVDITFVCTACNKDSFAYLSKVP
jgi:hypothetical protein